MNHEQLKRLEFILKRLTSKVDVLEEKVRLLVKSSLTIPVKGELEERVKELEEHYIYELRKATEDEVQEDANQMKLPLLTQTDRPCDCEDYPCCGHTAIKSPLQDW